MLIRKKMTVLLGLLLFIFSFTTISVAFAESSIDSNLSTPDTDIFIDASVQGHNRDVILNVMRTLDTDERENVIYIDSNGSMYANKPGLLKKIAKLKKVGKNSFETPDGAERYALPNSADPQANNYPAGQLTLETTQASILTNTQSLCTTNSSSEADSAIAEPNALLLTVQPSQPTCISSTGPYRRITSLANYSWESAYVHLPGATEISDHNDASAPDYNGDTGFVYMGGWGQNGGNVDAGLMHSTRFDNWSPLFNIEGSGVYSYTDRFASNQNINIKFKIPSDNNISLTISGILYGGTIVTTLTFVHAANGFIYNGMNILKRVTSIGQSPQNLNSGSWINNVYWYNSLIGVSSTVNHTWLANDTYGYCSYNTSVVDVNYINAGEETDNINLF